MDDSQVQSIQAAAGVGATIGLVIALLSVVFAIIIYWKIFSKAGYSGAMSLLMLVPIANIVMICILAFGEWPVLRELNELRQRASMGGSGYPPSGYAQMQVPPGQPSGPGYPQNPQYRS